MPDRSLLTADLFATAATLLSKRPGLFNSDIRRAASTTYYAVFHQLAKLCADLLVGDENTPRGETAWRQAYRSLDHRKIADRFKHGTILNFPKEIQDFSVFFRKLQLRREECDYCFLYKPSLGAVEGELGFAKRHLEAVLKLDEKHLRAFAAYILLDNKRHRPLEIDDVQLPNPQGANKGKGTKSSS